MPWGTDHDASLERLQQVQGSLTVSLIMVPRGQFVTCTPKDTAKEIHDKNTEQFSFFPVTDGHRILGLYDATRWQATPPPNAPIGEDFHSLSEDILIAADASILDFVMQADRHPTNLVVAGSNISGLVSLSDVQQLPVRAALFSAITSFEMAMALAIESRWPKVDDWMEKLKPERREKIRNEMSKTRDDDGFVSAISFTQFADKKTLIAQAGISQHGKGKTEKLIKRIQDLRDSLAHANTYANSPEAAHAVCETTRSLYDFKRVLTEYVQNNRSSSFS